MKCSRSLRTLPLPGPNPSLSSGNTWTLRIHYAKDEQTRGYYHQFRGSNVQVFNTTVMFLKDLDQITGPWPIH